MIYAVIDTNVLVSSFLSKHENSATVKIVRAMGNGLFVPLYNREIIEEYRDVLSRPQFKIMPILVNALIEKIQSIGKSASARNFSWDFPDEDDRVFFEVAFSHSKHNAKLVTGNAKHFPPEPMVISPTEFCKILE